MARQLTLLDTPPAWRIDEATKAVGRQGLAEARASLQAAMAAQQRAVEAAPTRRRSAA